jgi:3-deoxy-D-manno-octulosonic-acid transferase
LNLLHPVNPVNLPPSPRRPSLGKRLSFLAGSVALDLAYLGLSPLILGYVLLASAGFTKPKYRRGLLQKLGLGVPARGGERPALWVHAVSVGEVLTALPLVEALRSRFPGWDLALSVSTFTGLEVARQRLRDVSLFYFPLDLSPVVSRCFQHRRPTALILLELELWPNFLLGAARRGIPVFVANARITARSARRYALGGWLTRKFFNLVTSFGAQNELYRKRLLDVGAHPERVEILGNLKHDKGPSPCVAGAKETRSLLGWGDGETLILVAGSTHPGEERILAGLYHELKGQDGRLRLVLVPRHVERLDSAELARWEAREPLVRWSAVRKAPSTPGSLGTGILLVDTVGELELFYALADIVFVGGSLVPRGGHNLLEAARLGKAILFGPHFENFQEEGELLLREGAARSIGEERELRSAVERLLASSAERRALGEKALSASARLQGATGRHLAWLERQLQLSLSESVC